MLPGFAPVVLGSGIISLQRTAARRGFRDKAVRRYSVRAHWCADEQVESGQFRTCLDLSKLEHDSTIGSTAKLLDRVKENLKHFIPPRSLSVVSLAVLSKCHNLRSLNFSVVDGTILLMDLEEVLRNCKKLRELLLPHHSLDIPPTTAETNSTPTTMHWPASLKRMFVSGTISNTALSILSWPRNLTSLNLDECNDLSVGTMRTLLSAPRLGASLKELIISELNRYASPESINLVPVLLPNLHYLRASFGLIEDSFFDTIADLPAPWPVRVLEISMFPPRWARGFSPQSVRRALHTRLTMLHGMGFGYHKQALKDEEVEAVLRKRAEMQNISEFGDVGIYCF